MTEALAPPLRKPGLLGVCSGLAEDFGGFDPEYLRVAFVAAMLWNAYVVAGVYLALAAVVAASRWLVPGARKSRRAAPMLVAETAAPAPIEYARAA